MIALDKCKVMQQVSVVNKIDRYMIDYILYFEHITINRYPLESCCYHMTTTKSPLSKVNTAISLNIEE